jgi:mRNA interferase MazF
MVRGDVWMVSLPFSGGREQAGERPAVVVQDEAIGQGLPLVVVIPLTSQLAAKRFPGTMIIRADTANGLSSDSVALCFQIRAIDRLRFVRKLGTVSELDMQHLFESLYTLLGRQ